ncbi:hypothetical protein FOA52_013557 [Chlamydomonas sp. UWO 241]|nr:hypothetical protein FOA52_013557 [Chlamydomonas sp. UWO 241]
MLAIRAEPHHSTRCAPRPLEAALIAYIPAMVQLLQPGSDFKMHECAVVVLKHLAADVEAAGIVTAAGAIPTLVQLLSLGAPEGAMLEGLEYV